MSIKNVKLLSLIVPCYDKEDTIGKTLESLLNQTIVHNLEIICIDDCSKDRTLSILNEYKAQYPDIIRVIHLEKNMSVFCARKIGMELATGVYIGSIDPDDWVDGTYYEELLAGAIKNNPYVKEDTDKINEIIESKEPLLSTLYGDNYIDNFTKNLDKCYDIVYTLSVLKYYSPTKILSGRNDVVKYGEIGSHNINTASTNIRKILTKNWHVMWNKIIKREIVQKIILPRYYINFMEDVVMSMLIFMNSNNIAIINTKAKYYYNLSDEVDHLSKKPDKMNKASNVAQVFTIIDAYILNHNKLDWYRVIHEYQNHYINNYGKIHSYLFGLDQQPMQSTQQPGYTIYKEMFKHNNYNYYNKLSKKDLLKEYYNTKTIAEAITMYRGSNNYYHF